MLARLTPDELTQAIECIGAPVFVVEAQPDGSFRYVAANRLELEIYAFNERACAHAERAGFVREGVKRKAYRRHGEWADGVMFALIREDLED